jgi:hypothetical protein
MSSGHQGILAAPAAEYTYRHYIACPIKKLQFGNLIKNMHILQSK